MEQTITPKPKLEQSGKKRIFVVINYMVIVWAILFIAAGTFDFPAAWAFIIIQAAIFLGIGLYVVRVNPEIINERGRKSDKTKSWDKIFAAVYAPQVLLMPLVAGLDYRFSWSTPNLNWQIIGALCLIPGFFLPYWAMMVNKFLTTTVRLQEERGHYVVTTGPYHFIRHPMYTGAILGYVGTPLILGSWWAWVPAGIAIAAIMGSVSYASENFRSH